jgi:hypothetical protein
MDEIKKQNEPNAAVPGLASILVPSTQPPVDQEKLQRFKALQDIQIATVKASLYPVILDAIQRRDRLYPEGVWPEQMVREFCKELELAEKHGLNSISLEEYAVREAAEDERQDGFQIWRDADDEVIRLMDRKQLASIVAGKVAEFLVKAEINSFRLDELAPPSPFVAGRAPYSNGPAELKVGTGRAPYSEARE